MGTERSIEYQGPCFCGHGEFFIDECTPDHGWPTSTPLWYESHIECAQCALKYKIEKRGKRFVLVEKSRLAQLEEIRHQAYVRGNTLMDSEAVKPALRALEELLASQRSVAAVCRVLKAAGLTYQSEATFRNHWHGPTAWVRSNIRPKELSKVLALVKIQPEEVLQELSAIQVLSEEGSQPAEPIGPIIYELQARFG